MDGTAVESAFALLLTKVTKPPYPANISFYTIARKDTNLCAMSGTGFRKRGEEYDDENRRIRRKFLNIAITGVNKNYVPYLALD